jgi:hypothetical protein
MEYDDDDCGGGGGDDDDELVKCIFCRNQNRIRWFKFKPLRICGVLNSDKWAVSAWLLFI